MAKRIIYIEQSILNKIAGYGYCCHSFQTDKYIYFPINEEDEFKKDRDYLNGYKDGFINGTDAKQNHKISIFGMDVGEILDVLEKHVRQKQKSETPDIPMGFKFNWHNRKEINNMFSELSKQGFKIYKAKE